MLHATSRERKLAILTGLTAAVLLFDRLWLRPLVAQWRQVSADTEAVVGDLQRSRNLIANETMIRDQWQKTKDEIAAAEKAMSFQSYLSAIEKTAYVTEKSRKSLPRAKVDGRTVEGFGLALSGSLRNVTSFLRQLQASPRLLRVTQFSIRSKEKSDELAVDVVISTFLASQAPAKGKDK